jgi:hypothetical protein
MHPQVQHSKSVEETFNSLLTESQYLSKQFSLLKYQHRKLHINFLFPYFNFIEMK